MKKNNILFIGLIVFILLNIVYLVTTFFLNNSNIVSVDNKLLSFNLPSNYSLKDNYDDYSRKFKMYNSSTNSSIDVVVLEQYPSNNVMYSKVQMSDSILYQMIGKISGLKKIKDSNDDNSTHSVYEYNRHYYDYYVKYTDSSVLVVLYVSKMDKYDDRLVNSFIECIKVKNEKV